MKYCKLLDAENQHHGENWSDGLDQDVFNFKHRVHSQLKELYRNHQSVQDITTTLRNQEVQAHQQAINVVVDPGLEQS